MATSVEMRDTRCTAWCTICISYIMVQRLYNISNGAYRRALAHVSRAAQLRLLMHRLIRMHESQRRNEMTDA
jgi:hypothetical protein